MSKNVFYFNPTCELAVANGSFSYMPPRLLRDFEEDCSLLPFIFSNPDDYLLTEKKPSSEFLDGLRNVGFDLPKLVNRNELDALNNLNELMPWGWSPATHHFFLPLKDKCSVQFKNSPVFTWQEGHRKLFERKTSLDFLEKFLNTNLQNYYLDKERAGKVVTSTDEIEILLQRQGPLVLKAPLSSSGRGIQIIWKTSLNSSNKQWISGVLNQQKYLVAEPYLDKITDLSFQFTITQKGEAEYLGTSFFQTNTNGQYRNSTIYPQLKHWFPEEFEVYINEMIENTADLLALNLKNSVFTEFHRGFLGIDAMIYREDQNIKIQPCIEINSRMNMGILTLYLEKHVHPEARGKFELFYGKPGEYEQFALHQAKERPLKFKEGKLSAGFLPLTEPSPSKQFGAFILL